MNDSPNNTPARRREQERSQLILAVETSCDETALALHDGTRLVSHCLFSQADIHSLYNGVVPELAARNHLQRLLPLLKLCLQKGNKTKKEITHIAYTMGPGLIGALMTGASFARSLAYGLSVPAVGMHHLEGHILSPLLAKDAPSFPYLTLLVSGGHTQLILAKEVGKYVLYGESLDDAAGEVFDKVASLLGLPYPGGKYLEELARKGNPNAYKLTVPMRNRGGGLDYNFSFSGLKTQVLYLARKIDKTSDPSHPQEQESAPNVKRPFSRTVGTLTPRQKADLAACFQMTIVQSLLEKTFLLAKTLRMKNIVIVGGVSANLYLRETARKFLEDKRLFFPPPEYCTDNAAMIALAASYRIAAGARDSLVIRAKARLPLAAPGPIHMPAQDKRV